MSVVDQELGPDDVWKLTADQILHRLSATPAGLDTAETRARQEICGLNDAADAKHSPLWLQFLARFRSPLVIILLAASALSAPQETSPAS
jgi:P-type Mg2+ transporter